MDLATEEQRARIAQIKAQTERLSAQPVENEDDGVEIINDADRESSEKQLEKRPKKQVKISDIVIRKYLPLFNDKKHKHIILTSGRSGTKSSYAGIRTIYQITADAGSVLLLFFASITINCVRQSIRKCFVASIDCRFRRIGFTSQNLQWRSPTKSIIQQFTFCWIRWY